MTLNIKQKILNNKRVMKTIDVTESGTLKQSQYIRRSQTQILMVVIK